MLNCCRLGGGSVGHRRCRMAMHLSGGRFMVDHWRLNHLGMGKRGWVVHRSGRRLRVLDNRWSCRDMMMMVRSRGRRMGCCVRNWCLMMRYMMRRSLMHALVMRGTIVRPGACHGYR